MFTKNESKPKRSRLEKRLIDAFGLSNNRELIQEQVNVVVKVTDPEQATYVKAISDFFEKYGISPQISYPRGAEISHRYNLTFTIPANLKATILEGLELLEKTKALPIIHGARC